MKMYLGVDVFIVVGMFVIFGVFGVFGVFLRGHPEAGAARRRRTCSRSSGVSTTKDSYSDSTAFTRIPCSSARSCSSDSARSRVGGSNDARAIDSLRQM